MRKFAIALSAFAALGLAAPLTVLAQAEDAVVIKSEPVHKKVIIKKDEPRAEAVVVKKHRPADKKVIIKHDND